MNKKIIRSIVLSVIISIIGITTVFATGGIKSAILSDVKVYFENKNIPLSNSLVSIIKEGDTNSLTYGPVRELFENLGYDVKWDNTDNSVRLSAKVISTFDEFYNQTFPLIAADYDENAYLYAVGFEQTVLKYKGISKAFDWICTTPRFILPRLQVFDYIKNGVKEIAISLNVASGTGLGIDELHIIEVKKDADEFIDYKFMPEDYIKQISDNISYKVIGDKSKMSIRISSEKSSVDIDITDYVKEYAAVESDINLSYGSIVEFTPEEDGRIELKAGLGITMKGHPDAMYIAELKADITYSSGKFTLSNYNVQQW